MNEKTLRLAHRHAKAEGRTFQGFLIGSITTEAGMFSACKISVTVFVQAIIIASAQALF